MSAGASGPLNRQFDRLWNSGTDPGLDDAELLKRFSESKGQVAELAFEGLLDRHGPLVLGVCRQLLGRTADADDAFQATFLILVRKAGSIRVDSSLAPWHYAVAYRTASRARVNATRRGMARLPDEDVVAEDSGRDSFAWEVRPVVYEEIYRLPEKYRAPIVLCHLEGKSHEEAARFLRWPVGTVSGRLSRGRQLLKARLERRGLTCSAGVFAARFPGDASPIPPRGLLSSTLRTATDLGTTGALSTTVLDLSQGVLSNMLITKLRIAAIVTLFLGAISWGAVAISGWNPGAAQKPRPAPTTEKRAAPDPQIGQDVAPDLAPRGLHSGDSASGTPTDRRETAPIVFDAFPGMKNTINFTPAGEGLPVLRNSNVMIVETADGTGWAAMATGLAGSNSRSGKWEWSELRQPVGVRSRPIIAGDTIGLLYKGERIAEVVAFSGKTAKWSTQRLREPVKDDLVPVVADGYTLY
jgi:RNA polymerase sigma factor (sigma-70 family)